MDDDSKNNSGIVINPESGTAVWESSQVDASIFFVLDTMSVGRISRPLQFSQPDGTSGFKIVKLISKSEPHEASLDIDYDKIKTAAQTVKQEEIMNDWLLAKLNSTYLFIDEMYTNCSMDRWKSSVVMKK